jgi:holo-[acyl-carrier protein] synthase
MTLGVDIVEIRRIRHAARRPAFWDRILTLEEKRYCQSKGDGIVSLAGRFAAMEAVMKSVSAGLGDLSFQDIEIISLPGGAPLLRPGQALLNRMNHMGIHRTILSVSHSRAYAMAVAIGEESQ